LRFRVKKGQEQNSLDTGEKSINKFTYEALKYAGLQILTTERVYEREREQAEFNKLFKITPGTNLSAEAKFEFYVEKLDLIWKNFKTYHIAWFRAGSNPAEAKMLTALEGMKKYTNVAIERNRDALRLLNKDISEAKKSTGNSQQTAVDKLKNRKEQLVRNFNIAWLELLMFYYINATANLSWKKEDVDKPIVLALQTVQPIQQDRVNMAGTSIPPEMQQTSNSTKKQQRV
jgi:hypothetical protein